MSILKKNRTTIILFALFLFSFVINYILVFDFNYKISSREYILFSDEVLNNGDNLSREELEKMSYDDKKELAGRYSAACNNEKSKEICKLILDKYPTDRDTIYLYSALLEEELNFSESIKFKKYLLPITTGDDLADLYVSLSRTIFMEDIDEAILYANEAVKLRESDNIVSSQNEIDYPKNILKVLNKLKEVKDKNPANPIEYYKMVIDGENTGFDYYVKKYMYLEYKEKYSESYPESFAELTSMFEKVPAY